MATTGSGAGAGTSAGAVPAAAGTTSGASPTAGGASAQPEAAKSDAVTRAKEVELIDKDGSSLGTFDGQGKPLPPDITLTKTADKDQGFSESGAFNINGQWATSVRYEAKLEEGQVAGVNAKFMNGRKQVATAQLESRDTAVEVLGERNVANIEAGQGKDKDSQGDIAKGKLQAEHLAYKQSHTPDRKPENTIEAGNDRETEAELDADVRKWVENRRRQSQQQRVQNEKIVTAEAVTLTADAALLGDGETGSKNQTDRNSNEDRQKAIPDHVAKRFVQVDDKYYFPDKSLAFEDRGGKLATRSENQEVVRSLVAIAQARGWNKIIARGSEEFRRSTWLEGSLQGIEVGGYKATVVEKAHLASLMERQDPERGADLPNSIEQGRTRTSNQARPENTQEGHQEAVQAPSGPAIAQRPGAITGKLVSHGPAPYNDDPKKEESYFVELETRTGTRKVWGVDLERAINESGVSSGENITVEKLGSKPVTAKERVFDDKGNEVGARSVDTHRNKWLVGSLDKAQAFTSGEREEVVKKHPELAPAYGTVAAARKFAEREWPDNKETQDRFVAATKEVLAGRIASGEQVPAPKIRETRAQNQAQAPLEKKAEKELERER
jgi:hypothetical protein